MVNEEQELDLAEALGAETAPSAQLLSLYIPNKDQRGREFNAIPWIREAAEILLRIGRGATVMPPCDGVTLDEAGAPQWEKTVIVYAYVTVAFRQELPRLREFLHRFGRETDQREVVVEVSGNGGGLFFRISTFEAV